MSITPPPNHAPQNPGVPDPVGSSLLALSVNALPDAPPLPLYLAAIDALVHWQLSTPLQGLPVPDAAFWNQGPQGFRAHYVEGIRKAPLDAQAHQLMASAFAAIAAQCQALGAVAPVHGACSPASFHLQGGADERFELAQPPRPRAGPITYDIACLVRAPGMVWEENFVLDVCIRYWERARKAGLPVNADFGEFYRGVEWCGLHHHLGLVSELSRAALASSHPTPELPGLQVLLHYIVSTCGRYIELKPLMRLIERVEGIETVGGYAFGRV
jgi:N-acetylmuramate 1-kinase